MSEFNEKEYLLTCLFKECVETAHQISEFLEKDLSNAERISQKLNDLQAVVEMLLEKKIIPPFEDFGEKLVKKTKVRDFMQYSEANNTLRIFICIDCGKTEQIKLERGFPECGYICLECADTYLDEFARI